MTARRRAASQQSGKRTKPAQAGLKPGVDNGNVSNSAVEKRVFITGAGGMIGANLVGYLNERNIAMRLLQHRTALPDVGAEIVEGDISDFDPRWLDDVRAVIHLAAQVNPSVGERELTRVNVGGTQQLVSALRRKGSGIPLLFSSSIAALGPSDRIRNHNINSHCAPITEYGRLKSDAEKIVTTYPTAAIVRLPMVIGAGDRVSAQFKRLALMRIFPTTGSCFSAVDVRDVCRLIFHLLEHEIGGGCFNVSDSETYSWSDVADFYGRRYRIKIWSPFLPRNLISPRLFRLLGNEDIAHYIRSDWVFDPNLPEGFATEYKVFPTMN